MFRVLRLRQLQVPCLLVIHVYTVRLKQRTGGPRYLLTCKKGVTAISNSIPFYLYRAVMQRPNCTLYERKLHCIYIIYKAMTK